MNLANKNAIIYGAGGSLGGAVAKALAGAGARVFLTGRNLTPLQNLAGEIPGGKVEVDVVDAMDKKAIDDHLEKVLRSAGTLDISFNAIAVDVTQNIPLVNIAADDFVRTMADIANAAVFLSSDMAGKISGVTIDITCGTTAGLNYRVSPSS